MNGDGIDDLLIGSANLADDADTGTTWLVFGQAGGFGATLSLGDLDGSNGFRIEGIDPGDRAGLSIAHAGDINGDGYEDILIGAYMAARKRGETGVIYGRPDGFAPVMTLRMLNGINGFRIDGVDIADQSGWAVSAAGDLNGDGVDDLMIGAPGATPRAFGQAGDIGQNDHIGIGQQDIVYRRPVDQV